MTKQIEAVYENGVFRAVHPINVPEGERLHLIVITRKEAEPNCSAWESLAEIAALPIEGESGAFSAESTTPFFIHNPDDFRRRPALGSPRSFPLIRIILARRRGWLLTLNPCSLPIMSLTKHSHFSEHEGSDSAREFWARGSSNRRLPRSIS